MASLVRQVIQDLKEIRVAMVFQELLVCLDSTEKKVTPEFASLVAQALKEKEEIVVWTALTALPVNEDHLANVDILDNLVTMVFLDHLVYLVLR